VETGIFKIAPKVSTVIKIGGALLVIGGGVAAATLLNNDGKPPGDSSLPDQPLMPTNN